MPPVSLCPIAGYKFVKETYLETPDFDALCNDTDAGITNCLESYMYDKDDFVVSASRALYGNETYNDSVFHPNSVNTGEVPGLMENID